MFFFPYFPYYNVFFFHISLFGPYFLFYHFNFLPFDLICLSLLFLFFHFLFYFLFIVFSILGMVHVLLICPRSTKQQRGSNTMSAPFGAKVKAPPVPTGCACVPRASYMACREKVWYDSRSFIVLTTCYAEWHVFWQLTWPERYR